MEYPSLTDLSAMQPPNLRPRESQGRVRREIIQPRVPASLRHNGENALMSNTIQYFSSDRYRTQIAENLSPPGMIVTDSI